MLLYSLPTPFLLRINGDRQKGSPTDCGNKNIAPGHVAQWLKVVIAKLDGLSSLPKTVQCGEGTNTQKLSSDFHVCGMACGQPHIQKHIYTNK